MRQGCFITTVRSIQGICHAVLESEDAHLDAPRHSSGGKVLIVAIERDGAQHVRGVQHVPILQRGLHLSTGFKTRSEEPIRKCRRSNNPHAMRVPNQA